jgi:subtilisin-like proprotein convertase family protein
MNIARLFAGGVVVAGLATSAHAQLFEVEGNVPVPDGTGEFVGLELNVPNIGAVLDLDVSVIITTPWQGDIIAEVEQVGGRRVRIIDRPGYDGTGYGFPNDNFGDIFSGEVFTLDDQAASTYDSTGGIDNVTGPWQTDGGLLSMFGGDNFGGDWILWVSDSCCGEDQTAIRYFGLTSTIPEPTTLGIFGLVGLAMAYRRR